MSCGDTPGALRSSRCAPTQSAATSSRPLPTRRSPCSTCTPCPPCCPILCPSSLLPKNSPNQDAAWEFAKWFSSKEFGLAATKVPSASSAIHSPRISVLQDPGTKAALPYVDALLASLRIAKERPRLREFADIQEHFRVTTGKLTAGELTLDAALKEIDAGTNRILGK